LLVQALVAGSATILIVAIVVGAASNVLNPTLRILLGSLIVSLAMNMGEISLPHVSEDVRLATRALITGRLSGRFWGLVVGIGLIVPILFAGLVVVSAVPMAPVFAVAAAVLALAGLWWFEELWVKAGQSVPLS
jgi:formate-dependent nitrite reductase membrane component NrfD